MQKKTTKKKITKKKIPEREKTIFSKQFLKELVFVLNFLDKDLLIIGHTSISKDPFIYRLKGSTSKKELIKLLSAALKLYKQNPR